jgi:hypothetical protein
LNWSGISWYHCVAENSKIPKMPVVNPLEALVYPQAQKRKKGEKKTILHGLSTPNPNFSDFEFLVNTSADWEL